MLHLTNGEATASLLRLAEVPGVVRSVDDILMEGPLRNGLAAPQDLTFRAAWLEKRLAIPKGDYLAHAGRRSKWAREATGEVVLWSEEDLFCQANLAELLTRLPESGVHLVTPARDEDRLGMTPVAGVAAILATRREVTPARRAAARRFWQALAAPDPTPLVELSRSVVDGWPQLARAASLHLQRFPWTTDGLSLLERALLTELAASPQPFARLFALASTEPLAGYGMGDAQMLASLRAMAQGDAPLVYCDDPRAMDDPKTEGAWGITPLGRDVLAGTKDAARERGVDTWLGGVELQGRMPPWRYDPSVRALVGSPR